MTYDALESELRRIINRFGYDRVNLSLRKIGRPAQETRGSVLRDPPPDNSASTGKRKPRRRPTPLEYVSKMDLSRDRRQVLMEAADSFQNKSFLPATVDVRNFCEAHGIDGPSPRSRAAAAPRLLRFLATMDVGEVRRLLSSGMYSGPARLGPIADAIRNAGRERIRARALRNAVASARRAAD